MMELTERRSMGTGAFFGWNGICFDLPEGWELARIGKSDLAFEEADRMILEMRWKRGEDRVGLERTIRRRIERYARDGVQVHRRQPPPGWLQAQEEQEAEWAFLEWRRKPDLGMEIVRACSVCGMVCIFRVHPPGDAACRWTDGWCRMESVLRSFSDHVHPGGIRFSLYDIDLLVPEDFRLNRFSFHPGAFELQFYADHGNIRFHRWAPAALLLQGKPLEFFGATIFEQARWRRLHVRADEEAVLGDLQPQGWLDRIRLRAENRWFCLQYDRTSDRLLGIRYAGRKRHTDDQIERLSRLFRVRRQISI